VPCRKRKQPLRGIGKAMGPFCPVGPNVVWALDFQSDQASEGRKLKFLKERHRRVHPRGAGTDVERSIDADGSSPASSAWRPSAVLRPTSPVSSCSNAQNDNLDAREYGVHLVHPQQMVSTNREKAGDRESI